MFEAETLETGQIRVTTPNGVYVIYEHDGQLWAPMAVADETGVRDVTWRIGYDRATLTWFYQLIGGRYRASGSRTLGDALDEAARDGAGWS